jgi:hypothetical protein
MSEYNTRCCNEIALQFMDGVEDELDRASLHTSFSLGDSFEAEIPLLNYPKI